MSVSVNSRVPYYVLKKKINSIGYNFVREGCAQDVWRCAFVNTDNDPSDLCTNPIPFGAKRQNFYIIFLHHQYGYFGHIYHEEKQVIKSFFVS